MSPKEEVSKQLLVKEPGNFTDAEIVGSGKTISEIFNSTSLKLREVERVLQDEAFESVAVGSDRYWFLRAKPHDHDKSEEKASDPLPSPDAKPVSEVTAPVAKLSDTLIIHEAAVPYSTRRKREIAEPYRQKEEGRKMRSLVHTRLLTLQMLKDKQVRIETVALKLNMANQNVRVHMRALMKAGLIAETRHEKKSGFCPNCGTPYLGVATFTLTPKGEEVLEELSSHTKSLTLLTYATEESKRRTG